MATEYSGSDASFPATVTLPSDGDPRNAASVNDGLSDLADRTAWLKGEKDAHDVDLSDLDSRLTDAETSLDELEETVPGFGEVEVPVALVAPTRNLDSRFAIGGSIFGFWGQNDTTTAGSIWFPVALPPHGTVSRARLWVQGDAHVTLSGVTMPKFRLHRMELGEPGEISLDDYFEAEASDTSASVEDYQEPHPITIELDPVLDLSDETLWIVEVIGATGANAATFAIRGATFLIGRPVPPE
jgi:hypothetical protein